MTRLNPYIGFDGTAREAIEFYKSVFGGKLTMSTYKDAQASRDPKDDDKIMHAMLEADNGILLMCSDNPTGMPHDSGANISISLSGEDDAELSGYFEKLSSGGKIEQPLVAAPWGDKFGMLTDKYGTHWMINISAKKS
jgi:PhnB protein